MTETNGTTTIVDVVGETCPIPLVEMRKAVMKANIGDIIEVIGTHPASKDEIPMAVRNMGLTLMKVEQTGDQWRIWIKKSEQKQ